MLIKEDKWSNGGCYHVEGLPDPIYNGKVAMEYELQGKKVTFDFFDDLFIKCRPWVEPKQSLADMYSRRVRQLRAKYDYIVLMYSGGADSHNILKFFEHTGEHLDEIITFEDSAYLGKDSIISSEVYRVAVPEVNQFCSNFPKTEFRLLNIREVQKEVFTNPELKFDPFYSMSYHFVPFSVMHAFGPWTIKKYHDLHAQGKKVCIIHGIDKPRLRLGSAGNWEFRFNDFTSHVMHKHYDREYPYYDEFFYWTPDDPWLSIKQAHVTAKHLDQLDQTQMDFKWRLDHNINCVKTKAGKRVNWELMNHVIYPFWNQFTYSSGKQTESIFTNSRDPTLSIYNDEMFDQYKKGTEKSKQLAQLKPATAGQLRGTDETTVVGINNYFSRTQPLEFK